MKKFVAALAAALLAASAGSALAGVIVHEHEVREINGQKSTSDRTLMIQGNKQKTVMDQDTVVTDLDNGKMMVIEPAKKIYLEMPFPPTGPLAHMHEAGQFTLNFKKTGRHDKILGYKCDEYSASGQTMAREYSVVACFSEAPPGATDYTAFQKEMAAKLKGTSLQITGKVPDGLPLYLKSTSKVVAIPGMSAEQRKKFSAMIGKQAVVTTTVTKIAKSDLPADAFVPPKGFEKKEIELPQMPPGHPAMPHQGAPHMKVPE
jgi:Domain of unknown function (DUF4412)